MNLYDINNRSIIEFCNIRKTGFNINMDIAVTLKDAETDTDMSFLTKTSLFRNDLLYVKTCYEELYQRQRPRFGFASGDRGFSLWVDCQDVRHDVELYDTRYNSQFQSKCIIHFQSSLNMIPQLCKSITNVLDIPSANDTVEHSIANTFSIFIPEVAEFISEQLIVLVIDIKSPFYHVRRKFDSTIEEVENLKKSIEEIKAGNRQNFQIAGDFLEINFIKFGDEIDIQGEVSDFLWPDPNEIRFHELTSINILDNLYTSLDKIKGDYSDKKQNDNI